MWFLSRLINFAQIYDGLMGILSFGFYKKSLSFEICASSIYMKCFIEHIYRDEIKMNETINSKR